MFIGEYRHNIDAKGRLMLPAKLREKLGDEFIFSRGLDKCVCIYPVEEWKNFTAKIEELPVARERHVRRYFFSGASEGTPDAQGRVTLTQTHREFANLKKEVVIVGNCTHLEIWSAEEWDAEQQKVTNVDVIQDLIELGF
ncbi:MAG: division/cell wall cluster transcriptional repressor MraZ [Clostridia bacterium]|nr:division/cell wall cluster transcriptional repressor MraZ [Clostridia bacterium]MBO5914641.1 division/cell wall cluster transcriptional repressor MraZ [Clostridia bacterium]